MAAVTTSNPSDFASRTATYYNPQLLKALEWNLVLAQFGFSKAYPATGSTIRFFRPRPAVATYVGTPNQGDHTNLTQAQVEVGYVDVALAQKAEYTTITDIVLAIDLLDTVGLYVKTMAADAALSFDGVIRAALVAGLFDANDTFDYNYFDLMASVVRAHGTASHAAFDAISATASDAKITRARHLQCITQLKKNRVPKINGRYIVATPAEVIFDIRQDTDWVGAAKEVVRGEQAITKDAEFELDGGLFITNQNPHREAHTTYDTYSATGNIFSVFYLGEGAFGVPMLSNTRAGGSPMGPRMTVLAQPDKADPLNLKTYIGWKAYYGCKALHDATYMSHGVPHYVHFRCRSTF